MKKLTKTELQKFLNYDRQTGIFTWKKVTSNRVSVGDVAGCDNGKGYIRIKLNGQYYVAHRLAWLHKHNVLPSFELDHINRDRKDNRVENLKRVTRTENNMNHPLRKDNKSGCTGVQWYPQYNKWYVSIKKNKKCTFLGYFEDLQEAILVRKQAEKDLGFSKTHGQPKLGECRNSLLDFIGETA